jgi:hypothetical protein
MSLCQSIFSPSLAHSSAEILATSSRDLSAYVKEVMGEEFTPKTTDVQ